MSEIDFNNMTIAEIQEEYTKMKNKVDKIDRFAHYNGLNSIIEMTDDDCYKFHKYFEYFQDEEHSDTESVNSQDNPIVQMIGKTVNISKNFKTLFPEDFNINLLDICKDELNLLKSVIKIHFCPKSQKFREIHVKKFNEFEELKNDEEKQNINRLSQIKLVQCNIEAELQKNEKNIMRKYLKSLPKLDRKTYANVRNLESNKIQFSVNTRQHANRLILEKMAKELGLHICFTYSL